MRNHFGLSAPNIGQLLISFHVFVHALDRINYGKVTYDCSTMRTCRLQALGIMYRYKYILNTRYRWRDRELSDACLAYVGLK